ncbi:MAG: hypothetical protein AAF184_11715 [Pseudomonadota bacterium]
MRRALRYWDPIGVIEDRVDGAAPGDDEYDSYAIGLLTQLQNGADAYKLSRHFSSLRTRSMSFGNPEPTEHEVVLAEKLIAWRESNYGAAPDFSFDRYSI